MVIKQRTGRDYDKYDELGITYLEVGKNLNKDGTIPYATSIKISREVTYNCQMTTIGNMSALLGLSYKVKDVVDFLKLLKSEEHIYTRCILVDIYGRLADKFLEAIKKLGWIIVFDTRYVNTTSSKMAMIYIDIHPEWDDDDDDY